jgi:hypothetical protein
MKALFVVVCLLMTGCATGVTSYTAGDESKNGAPVRFERLGTMTSEDISASRQCRSTQVKVCTMSDAREDCGCMFIDDVQRRVQSVVRRQRRNGRP